MLPLLVNFHEHAVVSGKLTSQLELADVPADLLSAVRGNIHEPLHLRSYGTVLCYSSNGAHRAEGTQLIATADALMAAAAVLGLETEANAGCLKDVITLGARGEKVKYALQLLNASVLSGLESLALVQCELTLTGHTLENCTHLKSLVLTESQCRDSLSHLVDAEKLLGQLEELSIDGNLVDDAWVESFVRAIKPGCSLERLNLSDNRISDEGAHG